MRPTVHDIAATAGVSLATVDRVLNGRPGVRTVTRQKVEEAIGALGFTRDMAAVNLAKGRVYPFVFIVPQGNNSFMTNLKREIRDAATRLRVERTSIRLVEVPPFDVDALVAAITHVQGDKLAGIRPAGVALVAIDAPAVRAGIADMKAAGIPVVTLVSDVPGAGHDHYAGIDNLAAGRTAGSLMGRFLDGREGSVLVLAGSMLVRDHAERLQGFAQSMARISPTNPVLPVLEGQDDPDLSEKLVREALGKHGDCIGLYSLGAGNRGMIRALEQRGLENRGGALRVIAHELTPHSRAALAAGMIDAVLNQDAGHEVRSAIRVLKAKADGQSVITAQERIRIDIFLNDNLPPEMEEENIHVSRS